MDSEVRYYDGGEVMPKGFEQPLRVYAVRETA
jgi:hypothetical protein